MTNAKKKKARTAPATVTAAEALIAMLDERTDQAIQVWKKGDKAYCAVRVDRPAWQTPGYATPELALQVLRADLVRSLEAQLGGIQTRLALLKTEGTEL